MLFGNIQAIQTRNVVFIRCHHRLLRLRDLEAIRNTRNETILGLRELLLGKVSGGLRDLHLIGGRADIQVRGSDLILNPIAQIGRFGFSLFEESIRFQNLRPSALSCVNRNAQRALHEHRSV